MSLRTSALGNALLGLIEQQPLSGYDLRKLFSATPLTTMSDSPGAIYPALKRLERKGLISGRIEGAGLRRRRVFRLTARGLAELKKWLSQPVTRDDLVHRTDELILRFGFMSRVLGEEGAVGFLRGLERELGFYIPELKRFLSAQPRMPASGRLALELGIESYVQLRRWTKCAARAIKRAS